MLVPSETKMYKIYCMETYQLIYTVTGVSEWKDFFSQFNDNILISCNKDTISMLIHGKK